MECCAGWLDHVADVVTVGTGEVEQTADRAEVTVSYDALGADRAEAVSALNQKVAGVEPLLTRPGVEVRSRRLDVHDNWDGQRRAGSMASQNYVIRVSDPEQLDALLGELVQAEPSWMNGPTWQLSDDADAVREAQAKAIADAHRRAEGYASALDRRLGPLHKVVDGQADQHVPMARAMAYGAPGGAESMVDNLNLTPQPITVRVTCTVTWSLFD
jgi:uncharacterized protein